MGESIDSVFARFNIVTIGAWVVSKLHRSLQERFPALLQLVRIAFGPIPITLLANTGDDREHVVLLILAATFGACYHCLSNTLQGQSERFCEILTKTNLSLKACQGTGTGPYKRGGASMKGNMYSDL